jgi:hypothetical protein
MDFGKKLYSRRAMLKQGSAVLASLAAVPLIFVSKNAMATKLAKSDLSYQDRPKDGKKCVDCAAFVLEPGAPAGACKVVTGPISPDGWCVAFSLKEQKEQRRMS